MATWVSIKFNLYNVYNTQKRDHTRMVDATMESNEGGERKLSVGHKVAM